MPSRDQWANWKDHPVTQAMIKILSEQREMGLEEISMGADDADLLRYGIKVGKINAFTGIINFGFIQEEDDD
jgi:hypothetical protein